MSKAKKTDLQREWLSDKHLSQRLGVSRATVWNWAKDGRLAPPVKLGKNTTRWRLSDVQEFEQSVGG